MLATKYIHTYIKITSRKKKKVPEQVINLTSVMARVAASYKRQAVGRIRSLSFMFESVVLIVSCHN